VQSNGRGRDLWRRRASRDPSPTGCDVLQHAKNARPLVPQFGAALNARAGLGSWGSHAVLREQSLVSSLPGEGPILVGLAKRSPALQACIRTRNSQADGAPKGVSDAGGQKPPALFFPLGSPELCLQNAPRSLGATSCFGLRLRRLRRRGLGLAVPEALGIERLLLPQHVVHGPSQACGEDP
jgi:hypothetical protein